jgi:hypothetical protein
MFGPHLQSAQRKTTLPATRVKHKPSRTPMTAMNVQNGDTAQIATSRADPECFSLSGR